MLSVTGIAYVGGDGNQIAPVKILKLVNIDHAGKILRTAIARRVRSSRDLVGFTCSSIGNSRGSERGAMDFTWCSHPMSNFDQIDLR